jgi:DNA/RNA endonuclease YhcR with UshA esterase domain
MRKVVFLLSVAVLLSAGAQESKNDSAAKTNSPVQISATEAKEHIGAQAVVKGKVAEVNVGERIVRVNFEQPYPKNPFTAVIFPANTNKFPEVEKLKGKTVEISGKIAVYRERPQIVLTSTNQVSVIEGSKDSSEKK